jgi:hypothetical protein
VRCSADLRRSPLHLSDSPGQNSLQFYNSRRLLRLRFKIRERRTQRAKRIMVLPFSRLAITKDAHTKPFRNAQPPPGLAFWHFTQRARLTLPQPWLLQMAGSATPPPPHECAFASAAGSRALPPHPRNQDFVRSASVLRASERVDRLRWPVSCNERNHPTPSATGK